MKVRGARSASLLVNLALGLALAGCSGESLVASVAVGSAPPATAGGPSGVLTASTPDKPEFNPFALPGGAEPSGRDVIEKPTMADVMLAGPLPDRVIGRADAPVTIVKYASLTCPFCRKFQLDTFPQLKRDYIDTGKVRFILREFPIGKQSGQATVAWRCASPEKQLAVYERFLSMQAQWVSQEVRLEPIAKIAAQAGVPEAQLAACRADASMLTGLHWIKERGRKLGIIGTPNFFINDRLVKSVLDMKTLREIVDPMLAGKVATTSTR